MALDAAAPITHFLDAVDRAFRDGDPEHAAKWAERDNVRLLQEQYRAIGQGDMAAFAGLLAEDVEFEVLGPAEVPFRGRWQGRQAVAEAVWRNFAMLEDQRLEVCSVGAQGDTVVVVLRERGRVRATGRDYAGAVTQRRQTARNGCPARVHARESSRISRSWRGNSPRTHARCASRCPVGL